MATFTTRKHRRLVVKFGQHGTVRFEDGVAEVEGDLAQRLVDYAERHPEYEIEADGEVEKPETPKQRAQREARERGLDDSGTIAEIQARIDEHDLGDADPEDQDDEGDEHDEFADPERQDD